MESVDKKLNTVLNIEESDVPEEGRVIHSNTLTEFDPEADKQYVRRNFYDIIEDGTLALENAVKLTQNSERASSFEAVASLLNAVSNANEKLLSLAHKEEANKTPNGDTNIQNNTVFLGSTKDLQELLKNSENN